MKKLIFKIVIPIIVIGMSLVACTKDEVIGNKLDYIGDIPEEVVSYVSSGIISEMKAIDMPIYTGEDPPIINGMYNVSPCIMLCSNIEGDTQGCPFKDVSLQFKQQDNDHGIIMIDYTCGTETVSDVKAFIIGNDNKFTVFAKVSQQGSPAPATYVCAISGKIVGYGISDIRLARFMYDDCGDPLGCLMENGKGRMFYDGDGFSDLGR